MPFNNFKKPLSKSNKLKVLLNNCFFEKKPIYTRDIEFALVFVFATHFSVTTNTNLWWTVFFGFWVHLLKQKHDGGPSAFAQAVFSHFFDTKLAIFFPVHSQIFDSCCHVLSSQLNSNL